MQNRFLALFDSILGQDIGLWMIQILEANNNFNHGRGT